MKNQIYLLLTVFLIACVPKQPSELSGIWDATKYIKYPSDTISIESDFDLAMEKTTVKTDSGVMVISHINDSIIGIVATSKITVLHFHFDDNTHGVLSTYDIDSELPVVNEDPRFTVDNYNFSVLAVNQRTYLIVDHHFDQFGRSLDTIEYHLISPNRLIISEDTLIRIAP